VGKPLCLAFTKADKVARHRHDRVVGEVLGSLGFGLPPRTGVVITSAAKGFGQDELWAWIEDHVTSGPAVGRRRAD
jgi:GTP-binding protein EngB required for normal cell division